MNEEVILICTPLKFYTKNDEDLCFEWIKKIKCIKKFKGMVRELHLFVSSKKIQNEELLDFIGLFDRYKFDSAQLKIFMNEENKHLFS